MVSDRSAFLSSATQSSHRYRAEAWKIHSRRCRQMNLYLNYAREHWTNPDENAPIGLILCSEHDTAVAHYALGNLGNQVLAREYQLTLPTEEQLARRIEAKRKELDR
jgi:hypothetical protein